ncbi:glycosyltransferase [Rhodococcus sp. BP-149]|uniref:glycosyltransferase n=1 Tax=unclassified Rhodococcus (in: high G+C Gram-positive bacteria) TaxID=192944 RepID=UPI001C9AB8FF|nr:MULTISPECIES: glycosyltransferase [unclassified Rhodococcus (in: high G+C Gram-positive bacteria)]MBY6686564.1 glycosyltransferase [Rhodococcus sp. BP-288]MBY6695274.1 glycosyltransferase [Rhodococcus sp. BP-188]MBY6700056.1 glycosyltransferase [Rhodococcus sp. BP-285]MBY6704921.1 glycosyltransferase [Rhodococcus sp. BP-283]MBY6713181.1 glycosyltransferase [Rhodococcus sp. BP-160]
MNETKNSVSPLVSVIMPVFNGALNMTEAIDSILAQTYSAWELLIVDDASTDNSLEIARRYEEADSRIKVIKMEQNSGSGTARNLAIDMSTGEYLAVMDADDVSLPHRLALEVETLNGDEALVAVAMQLEEFGPWGGPVRSVWPTDSDKISARVRAGKIPLPHPSTMFVAKAVEACGGYDVYCRRAQDYALFLKLGDQAFACLPTVGVRYRTERPVSFSYVLKNERYAELARLRHGPDAVSRSDKSAHVTRVPAASPKMVVRAAVSWIKRGLNERISSQLSVEAEASGVWPTWSTLPNYIALEGRANLREPKSFIVVVFLRVCQCLIVDRERPRLLGRIATIFYRAVTEMVFGIELRPKTRVGIGLVIFHGVGLVVNDQAVLGSGLILRNGVTIGNTSASGGSPSIGNDVEVGANAVIIGSISIGSGAKVGAGSVVTRNVAAGTTVVGNPARPIESQR